MGDPPPGERRRRSLLLPVYREVPISRVFGPRTFAFPQTGTEIARKWIRRKPARSVRGSGFAPPRLSEPGEHPWVNSFTDYDRYGSVMRTHGSRRWLVWLAVAVVVLLALIYLATANLTAS